MAATKAAPKKTKASVNDENKVKKGGKRKAAKDPNAPKRALTAYLYFANAKREEVKSANSDKTFGELNKLMGSMWREMSEADKKPYEDSAKADKARYEREKEDYKNGKAPPKAESDEAKSDEAKSEDEQ